MEGQKLKSRGAITKNSKQEQALKYIRSLDFEEMIAYNENFYRGLHTLLNSTIAILCNVIVCDYAFLF